jgi:hypothetical protein
VSVRPRSQRAPAQRKRTEKFVEKAFTDEILAKACLLVIHRVVRSMTGRLDTAAGVQAQREAIDKMMKFADGHPLPPELEKQL